MIRFYRLVDAAKELGRTRQRVWQIIQSRGIEPAAMAGTVKLYDEAGLQALKQANIVTCPQCDTQFQRQGGRQTYCSKECSAAVQRKLRAGYARKRYAKNREAAVGITDHAAVVTGGASRPGVNADVGGGDPAGE